MPRPRLHDQALRGRLLEVTSEVIASAGVAQVTVRDVAARAGTSASAVYTLFGSREALVAAVGDEAFAHFVARLSEVPRTDDPGADLLELGLAYRENALAQPHFYRVMFGTPGAGARDPSRATALDQRAFGALREAVDRVLAARGEPTDASHGDRAAYVLWGLAHGLVELELDGLLPGEPEQLAAFYRTALQAAGPVLVSPAP